MKYPYLPKSNQKLKLGEYWSIVLENGKHAFFVFLDIPQDSDRRSVLIGLVDYVSSSPVLPDSSYEILWQGVVHIKSVNECGGLVQGKIEALSPVLELCSHGGVHCRVLSGFDTLRMATPEDIEYLGVRRVCGFKVPQTMANKLLGGS